jgi:DNA modification methylase
LESKYKEEILMETNHKILCGDCLEKMKELPKESVDLIITDPPYNVNLKYDDNTFIDKKTPKDYINWLELRLKECVRILKENGSMYLINYPELNAKVLSFLEDEGLILKRWIVWNYPTNIGHSRKNWTRSHRSILFLTKGKDYTFNRQNILQHYKNPEVKKIKERIENGEKGRASYDTLRFLDLIELQKGMIDVLEMNLSKNVTKDRMEGHPCQLPFPLLELLIKVSSNPRDVILDPFAGTFSLSVIAKKLNRNSIGIDVSPRYCKLGKERLKENDFNTRQRRRS